MKTLSCLIALIAFGVCSVQGDNTAATDSNKTSTFKMNTGGRNPFWPIGWRPSGEQAGPDIPATVFVVSSITMDANARFAIINGKTMTEGQQFGLQIGGQTYQLTVKTIEDGRVILQRHNDEIIVPLHRK
jgi:hypothetical protein